MTPRASFVIPAYNSERWVSKCIYSCRNQTIKQVEIVVVNDASTDDTRSIIDWHAKEDPRVVPIHLEQNQGSANARNVGNARASAPIILVLDSDDMATRNRTKDTIAAMTLKKCDLLYGSFFVIDGMGNPISKVGALAFDPERSKREKLNYICHSTQAMTKKLAMEIPYATDHWTRLALEDWKFQWDAYRAGYKISHLKTPLCYYRDVAGGQTQTRDYEGAVKLKEQYLAAL